jgi:polygalacturonase
MNRLLSLLAGLSSLTLILGQDYRVLDFNATGNGIADDTDAVRAALAAAAATNGGRVIFDYGRIFLTGCFQVKKNIILDVRGMIKGSNLSDHYVL